MERNEGREGTQDTQAGAAEFSGAGSTQEQGSADGERAGSYDFAGAGNAPDQSQGITDRARNVLGNASGRLADVGSTVRERAGTAKDKLADALETGAERLRQRAQTGGGAQLAGATGDGTATIGDSRVAQISDRVAGSMERSADWLRDADLDGLKEGIERQVKEHPARTLLIAAGLGYLIGRAFRGDK